MAARKSWLAPRRASTTACRRARPGTRRRFGCRGLRRRDQLTHRANRLVPPPVPVVCLLAVREPYIPGKACPGAVMTAPAGAAVAVGPNVVVQLRRPEVVLVQDPGGAVCAVAELVASVEPVRPALLAEPR